MKIKINFQKEKLGLYPENRIKKGGIIDEQRTAIMIIRDWQIGKLLLD